MNYDKIAAESNRVFDEIVAQLWPVYQDYIRRKYVIASQYEDPRLWMNVVDEFISELAEQILWDYPEFETELQLDYDDIEAIANELFCYE